MQPRFFHDISTAWVMLVCELTKYGRVHPSRNGTMRESLNVQFTLTNLEHTFLLNPRRSLSPYYAAAELVWYLMRTDSIEFLRKYAPQYKNFVQPNTGRVFGAYGHRLATNAPADLLWSAVNHLDQTPNTRRCVVSLWKPSDLTGILEEEILDVPCTVSWEFFVRDNLLYMTATMRSNDLWLGLPYDVFVNTCVQRMVADQLGYGYGLYTHRATSLHLYEKHWAAAGEAVDTHSPDLTNNYPHHCWRWSTPLNHEEKIIDAVTKGDDYSFWNPANMGADIVTLLTSDDKPVSQNLQEGIRLFKVNRGGQS
jgi:thymidylate synthase